MTSGIRYIGPLKSESHQDMKLWAIHLEVKSDPIQNEAARISYLCAYDLYVPMRNAFDAGSNHYKGQTPTHLPQKWMLPASKALRTGQYYKS
jgi:hypothetical protein